MASIISPCVGVCYLDAESGYCRGCLRTMEEISRWIYLDDDARRRVIESLPHRKIPVKPAGQPAE
jgi:predicted Fe-S protein YdhL (DUF1289 family)